MNPFIIVAFLSLLIGMMASVVLSRGYRDFVFTFSMAVLAGCLWVYFPIFMGGSYRNISGVYGIGITGVVMSAGVFIAMLFRSPRRS